MGLKYREVYIGGWRILEMYRVGYRLVSVVGIEWGKESIRS